MRIRVKPVFRRVLLLFLLLPLLLAVSCARSREEPLYGVGDMVSAYWFDFGITQVQSVREWQSYAAEEGDQLVLCTVKIRSTVEGEVPMGWDDFLLLWGDEKEAVAPLPYAADPQFPDEFELLEGDEISGLLVYEIPADVKEPSLIFQERFAEGDSGSTFVPGDLYRIRFALDPA